MRVKNSSVWYSFQQELQTYIFDSGSVAWTRDVLRKLDPNYQIPLNKSVPEEDEQSLFLRLSSRLNSRVDYHDYLSFAAM